MIPDSVPEEPESWQDFLKDIERVIMPGVSKQKQLLKYNIIDEKTFDPCQGIQHN